jgi:superfamily II DNA or RNA helicase
VVETAILEVGFDQCRLIGMDGKQLARVAVVRGATTVDETDDSPNGKHQEVSVVVGTRKREVSVCAGGCLVMGNKTVRIHDEVEEATYKSGAVFLAKPPDFSKPRPPPSCKSPLPGVGAKAARFVLAAARKPAGFVCPFKTNSRAAMACKKRTEPLFSPTAPNSLVLFSPSPMAKSKVAVVVDPKLSQFLRPHQREGVQFMFDCCMGLRRGFVGNGCILADGMGLGKTIQAISLMWTLLRQGPDGQPAVKKALIVAPSSLVANWVKEIKKWLGADDDEEEVAKKKKAAAEKKGTPAEPMDVAEGEEEEEDPMANWKIKVAAVADSSKKSVSGVTDLAYGDADVMVISYDQLKIRVEEIAKIEAIGLIICDEGHKLKNANIQASQAVAAIKARKRIILSGTPIQNDLGEFYAMVSFVNPGVLGEPAAFRKIFEQPIMEGRDPSATPEQRELGAQRSAELSRITGMFILRRSNAINRKYLPPKTEYTVFCTLTPVQRAAYAAIIEREAPRPRSSAQANSIAPGQLVAPPKADALQVITGLRKLCNHPKLLADMTDAFPWLQRAVPQLAKMRYEPEYSGKLLFLDCLVRAIRSEPDKDKLVIVSNYTQTLDVLADWCRIKRYPFFSLTGSTTVARRQQLVDRFNEKSSPEMIFLLSSKAGGCGLNLIGACHLVMFDPDWNPANDEQAMARVWRDGQKKRVRIYRTLSTGTIEEKIFQRQMTKLALSSQVVDKADNSAETPEFSAKELRTLFKLSPEETACDTHELLQCRCGAGAGKAPPRKVFAHEKGDIQIDALSAWKHIDDPAKTEDSVFSQCPPGLVSFIFAVTRETQMPAQLSSSSCAATATATSEVVTLDCMADAGTDGDETSRSSSSDE